MPTNKALRGRPTPADLETRKARVLEVAEALFVRRGLSATSVNEIARRSGVTTRLVTAHFGSKIDLFLRIITDKNARALDLVAEAGKGEKLDEILFDMAKFAWNVAYAPSAIDILRIVVGEGERLLETTSRIALDASDHFFRGMEDIFKELIRRGLISDPDAAKLAKYFVDLMVGFSLIQAGMGYWDRVPSDAELRDKVGFFCRGIAVAPSRQ